MDGHECEDVVKYQQEVFLPVIMYFHAECCFHVNDEAQQLW